MAASVSFGKGNKFPADVQEQVVNELKEFCAKRAENLDAIPEQEFSSLSAEDLSILKSLAEAVKKKTGAVKKASEVTSKVKFGPSDEIAVPTQNGNLLGRKAILTSTENLHPSQRAKAHSGMEVFINMVRPDGFVNLKTKEGYQFNVPKEDVEIQE